MTTPTTRETDQNRMQTAVPVQEAHGTHISTTCACSHGSDFAGHRYGEGPFFPASAIRRAHLPQPIGPYPTGQPHSSLELSSLTDVMCCVDSGVSLPFGNNSHLSNLCKQEFTTVLKDALSQYAKNGHARSGTTRTGLYRNSKDNSRDD